MKNEINKQHGSLYVHKHTYVRAQLIKTWQKSY